MWICVHVYMYSVHIWEEIGVLYMRVSMSVCICRYKSRYVYVYIYMCVCTYVCVHLEMAKGKPYLKSGISGFLLLADETRVGIHPRQFNFGIHLL